MKHTIKRMSQILATSAFCLFALASTADSSTEIGDTTAQSCDDPAEAVLRIMDCIESKNAFCAASGYASNFAKFHNTNDTDTDAPGYFFG